MERYSVQSRDWKLVIGYGFLSFVRNMGRNIGKKYKKKRKTQTHSETSWYAKQSATDAIKTASKRAI